MKQYSPTCLTVETKERLKALKRCNRDSYEAVIKRLLNEHEGSTNSSEDAAMEEPVREQETAPSKLKDDDDDVPTIRKIFEGKYR